MNEPLKIHTIIAIHYSLIFFLKNKKKKDEKNKTNIRIYRWKKAETFTESVHEEEERKKNKKN